MNFDSTISIATILALVAIVCPVLTAVINNVFLLIFKIFDAKRKLYKQNNLHKRELFENFLSAFNDVCVSRGTDENISRYASSYSLVYIYLPKEVQDELDKVNLLIQNDDWNEAIKYVSPISLSIYKAMKKLKL